MYTYVRVTCMWIIYIYTQYSIYIYYMYMDGHVYSTYMFMYLSMHACVANYNKCISDYSCCGKEPPPLQHPFLLLPLKAQPGRSTDWFNQQKWGDKPNFSKIGYYWFRNWCDVPPFVVRLLSVQKINIIWRVRKIAAFFLTNHVFLGCYGFVLGLSWVCPGLVHFNGGLRGSASIMVIWSASHDGTVLAMMGTPLSIATSLGGSTIVCF